MTGGVSRGAAAGLHGPMGGEEGEKEVESAKLKGCGGWKAVSYCAQRGWSGKKEKSHAHSDF